MRSTNQRTLHQLVSKSQTIASFLLRAAGVRLSIVYRLFVVHCPLKRPLLHDSLLLSGAGQWMHQSWGWLWAWRGCGRRVLKKKEEEEKIEDLEEVNREEEYLRMRKDWGRIFRKFIERKRQRNNRRRMRGSWKEREKRFGEDNTVNDGLQWWRWPSALVWVLCSYGICWGAIVGWGKGKSNSLCTLKIRWIESFHSTEISFSLWIWSFSFQHWISQMNKKRMNCWFFLSANL